MTVSNCIIAVLCTNATIEAFIEENGGAARETIYKYAF